MTNEQQKATVDAAVECVPESTVIYHKFAQRSDEWFRARCGKITCSELSEIITPAQLKPSKSAINIAYIKAAERIKGKSEETPFTHDMERGVILEEEARYRYELFIDAKTEEFGFIENTAVPVPFGYSPDGLIDDRKGGVEYKCPRSTGHLKTLFQGNIDGAYMLQMQGGMLAAKLEYIDFVSFHEGLKMKPIRVYRNAPTIAAILIALEHVEELILDLIGKHDHSEGVLIPMPKEARYV